MEEVGARARGSAIKVRLADRFTAEAACAVHLLARRVPRGTTLDLDFGGVRDCQEVALLMLAREVAAGAVILSFRGLSPHQRVVLGYLGVEVEKPYELEAD